MKIRKIERLGVYRLHLWFNDGANGIWDVSGLSRETGPLVEPFKDPAYFDRVFLEDGALTWRNGFDWSPEALYADMKRQARFPGQSPSPDETAPQSPRTSFAMMSRWISLLPP